VKFKEQRGNTFVFENELTGEELNMDKVRGFPHPLYEYAQAEILVRTDLAIIPMESTAIFFEDIQTAVNLMQILIKEGLV